MTKFIYKLHDLYMRHKAMSQGVTLLSTRVNRSTKQKEERENAKR